MVSMIGSGTLAEFDVGSAVRLLRLKAHKSARALSLECGLSPSYVGKVEAGMDPSLKAFARIALGLGMTNQEILQVIGVEGLVEWK